MENNSYNSLTEKLIQSGILQNSVQENKVHADTDQDNFFEIKPEEITQEKEQEIINHKRLNNYDLELLGETKSTKNSAENKLSKLLFKIFPFIYRIKIAKYLTEELSKLNIDPNSLKEKTIPYGEGEIRYKNLIKYLKYANEIQSKMKKIN